MGKHYGTGYIFQSAYKDRKGQPKKALTYSIAYRVNGKQYRESTGSRIRAVAQARLRQRLGEAEAGLLLDAAAEKNEWTIDDLVGLVEQDYIERNRRSLNKLRPKFKPLRRYFGSDDIRQVDGPTILAYRSHRVGQGAATGTANREVAILRRGLRLAHDRGLVRSVPNVPKLPENNVRQGFFERGDFDRVLSELDPWWHELYEVAYTTGWRCDSEICRLQWSQVDFANRYLRLEPGTTKNGDGRAFPMTPDLEKVMCSQRDKVRRLEGELAEPIPWVFPRKTGRRLTTGYKPFKKAAHAAGLSDKLQHDFRRTAVRNLEMAGISKFTAMMMVGMKTESIYRRYAIVDHRQLEIGRAQLATYQAKVKSGDAA
jgi:integrase